MGVAVGTRLPGRQGHDPTGRTPHRRGRARRRHPGPRVHHRREGRGRAGPTGPLVQRHAGSAGGVPPAAGPADLGRRPRAADPAHQPAHQHRGAAPRQGPARAGPGRPAQGRELPAGGDDHPGRGRRRAGSGGRSPGGTHRGAPRRHGGSGHRAGPPSGALHDLRRRAHPRLGAGSARPARAGRAQRPRQRRQVESAGWHHPDVGSGASRCGRSTSSITDPGSRQPTCLMCSTASTGRSRPGRCPARGWASPSCSR